MRFPFGLQELGQLMFEADHHMISPFTCPLFYTEFQNKEYMGSQISLSTYDPTVPTLLSVLSLDQTAINLGSLSPCLVGSKVFDAF